MTQEAASAIDIDTRERATIERLLHRHLPGVDVCAYGSRVRWNARPQSDLDLVAFASPEQRSAVLRLREAFEESSLPFSVDLLIWGDLPESFHREIEREYVVVQGGGREQRKVKLGDVAEIVMGQSPPGDTVSAERGLALLNGPTEFGPHHPTPVQFTTDPRKCAQQGDILFCVRGSTTGRMNWADRGYAIGRGVAAIRHRQGAAFQPLVRGAIELELPDLLAQATGSTFPNVSATQLADIPYPGLSENDQRAIAHILGTLDDKIELNRQMNQTLEEIARAIFQDWFVDFGPVRAKLEGREPYLPPELWDLFPDRLVDSELGEIPEGWEVKPLDELLSPKNQRAVDDKVPEYSSTNTGLQPREQQFKKQLSKDDSKNKLVHRGDLVFGLSRRILNFGLMREDIGSVSPAYRVFAVDDRMLIPDLAERLIRTHSDYYYGAISGSSREGQSISSAALGLLHILCPPASIQGAFHESVEPYFRRAAVLDMETRHLAAQWDALLPKLVSGDVGVGLPTGHVNGGDPD